VRLEELTPGLRVTGILSEDVAIIAVQAVGDRAVEVTDKDADGQVGQQLLYRDDEAKLRAAGKRVGQSRFRPLPCPHAGV